MPKPNSDKEIYQTAVASEYEMAPDAPTVIELLFKHGAEDLVEMLGLQNYAKREVA